MKRFLPLLLIFIFTSSFVYSQKIISEISLSSGLNFSIKDPFKGYTNQKASSPAFSFQLNYQLLFRHVGFNVSLEVMSKDIEVTRKNNQDGFQTINGQSRADRLMLYFVARASKESNRISMDLRFGLGKLLTSENYPFKNPFLNAIHELVPGLCFATGIKTNYSLNEKVGVFFDAKLALIPYSYSKYNDLFWSNAWSTHSSYLADLGLHVGLSIRLN